MRLQMARPRPVPPWVRLIETSACENRSNSRPRLSGAMPEPVSITSTLSRPERFLPFHWVWTVTEPWSVNFTALDRKFSSTWRRRAVSPPIRAGALGSRSAFSSRPLAAAWMATMPVVSSTSCCMETGWISSSACPASSLEKSSTSLMIASSASEASRMRRA